MSAAAADHVQLARRAWGGLECLHVIGYFAPETRQAYVDLGLHPRLSYFAARSAAMGPVGPELTVATFYVFAPDLVRHALPSAWAVADPVTVQRARREGVRAALRGVLGEVADGPEVAEAAELAREATAGLSEAGRPLYAAHAALDWPDEPLMQLWHAASLVREHRGDGHVGVLTGARLDPVESLVLGGLFSDSTDFVRSTRGWTPEQWGDAVSRLTESGLLDADGSLSEDGGTLRQEIEDRTDLLATAAFDHLGAGPTRRLIELVDPLRRTVLASGVLPDWISSRG